MEYSYILAAHPICIREMTMGLNISQSIWQSYINAILDCLQSKKYCEAIIDDLNTLHSIKGVPYEQIGRYIECFIKEQIEDIT